MFPDQPASPRIHTISTRWSEIQSEAVALSSYEYLNYYQTEDSHVC